MPVPPRVCATCTHWGGPDQADPDMRNCQAIVWRGVRPRPPLEAAYAKVEDDCDRGAWLATTANFSCALHDPIQIPL